MEGSFLLDGKSIKRYDNVLKNTGSLRTKLRL
jgi:hypothetical protein